MSHEEILEQSVKKPGRYVWVARVPFIAMAIVGITILLTLKWYGFNAVNVSLAAVGLLLTYAAMVYWVPHLRIREDQLGDNCYYLGFLFTLTSLGYALWQFSLSSDATEIIANFGIALASTIAGIMLRVFINQVRKDVLETERDARIALTETIVNMRVQLDEATIAMRAFCKRAEQITEDTIRNAASRSDEALASNTSKVGETTTTVLEHIDEAFSEFAENSKQLNQISSGTVKALKTLLTRIEKIDSPSDAIVRKLEPVIGVAERAANSLRERMQADELSIEKVASRFSELNERMEGAGEWIEAAGSGLAKVSEASMRATTAASNAAEQLAGLAQTTERAVREQERLAKEARESSERSFDALMESHNQVMRAMEQNLAAVSGALKTHAEAMTEEIARAHRMSTNTGTALADLADTVAARVKAHVDQAAVTSAEARVPS
jgi:hypothetical protein